MSMSVLFGIRPHVQSEIVNIVFFNTRCGKKGIHLGILEHFLNIRTGIRIRNQRAVLDE